MKAKPAVRNELFLEDALTVYNEDVGATLRVAVQYGDSLIITVHEPSSPVYRNILILLTEEQVSQLVTLWNEWKEEEDAEAD